MSESDNVDGCTLLIEQALRETRALRARVGELGEAVRRLRSAGGADVTASESVDELNRSLGRAETALRELSTRVGQHHAPAAKDRPGAMASPPAKLRVLVIDDEASVVNLVARILKSEGYEVETAGDGLTGIQMSDAHSYDLIMVDLKMPEVAGTDVFLHIETHNPEQGSRVVFFSGDVVSPQTSEFLRRSGRPFLVKPFTIQELVTFVERAIEEIKQQPGLGAQ